MEIVIYNWKCTWPCSVLVLPWTTMCLYTFFPFNVENIRCQLELAARQHQRMTEQMQPIAKHPIIFKEHTDWLRKKYPWFVLLLWVPWNDTWLSEICIFFKLNYHINRPWSKTPHQFRNLIWTKISALFEGKILIEW